MKIVIFGGTTEGRDISRILADAGAEVTVCVVSDYGARQQGEHPGVTVLVGPRDAEAMEEVLRGKDLCIDATHPYATEASVNIRTAARDSGLRLIRLRRAEDTFGGGLEKELSRTIVWADSREEAAALAREKTDPIQGNLLLTTGVRDLPYYAEALDRQRLYPRVLPSEESIASCKENGIPDRNIIAIQGPFSAQLNIALIREYHIAAMITKESGAAGGFREKLQACRTCAIPAIVIARPEEEGMTCEEVTEEALRILKGSEEQKPEERNT